MEPSNRPALLALALAALGLVLGLVGPRLVGAVIAALGAGPALYGIYLGMQKETQSTLALSILGLVGAAAAAALLIVLRIVQAI